MRKTLLVLIQSLVLLANTALAFSTAALAESAKRDLAQEEANRTLVLKFYDQFFNQHQVAKAAQVVADQYKQHNPEVPDGKAPFVNYFTQYFLDNPQSRAHVIRSASDGDLVYLHVHSVSHAQDKGQAVVDIFRVQNGKILEHWDVIQDVPAQAQNRNTMF